MGSGRAKVDRNDCPNLAFLVSSAICPEASKPVMTPAEKRLTKAFLISGASEGVY
jgi:hypothetical protein